VLIAICDLILQIILYALRGVAPAVHYGASSIIGRIDAAPGLVLKCPKEWWFDESSDDALQLKNKFAVEAAILRELSARKTLG
jgi:hypothetical protein